MLSLDVFRTDGPLASARDLYASGQKVIHIKDPRIQEPDGIWAVIGYDLVRRVLADTKQFSNAPVLDAICPVSAQAGQFLAGLPHGRRSVVASNPPEHDRMRDILMKAFPHTRSEVKRIWGPVVARRVNALIDELDNATRLDLTDVAARLTVQVIGEVLDLPDEDQHDWRVNVDSFAELAWSNPDDRAQYADAKNSKELWEYVLRQVRQRTLPGASGKGFIADLLCYRDRNGNALSLEQIALELLNMLGAGWKTNAAAICHTIELALAEPGIWARLAVDEQYLEAVVAEALRMLSPLGGWQRRTTTAVTIADVTIPADSRVLLMLGAANLDPSVFDDPEQFDPERPKARAHLAFGFGPHRCLGEQLALLVITMLVRALARRYPHLQPDPASPQGYKASAVVVERDKLLVTTGTPSGCPVASTNQAGVSGSPVDGNG